MLQDRFLRRREFSLPSRSLSLTKGPCRRDKGQRFSWLLVFVHRGGVRKDGDGETFLRHITHEASIPSPTASVVNHSAAMVIAQGKPKAVIHVRAVVQLSRLTHHLDGSFA